VRRIGHRLWRLIAEAGKAVLPARVSAPIQRKLGERADRRRVIDLSYVRVIRDAPETSLLDVPSLERLLIEAGLNDEILEQFPTDLRPRMGRGLRLWQYPTQFNRYLIELAGRGIERYMEIGVRHGGSFVTTVEYLSRFNQLSEATAVDIDPVSALLPYPLLQSSVRVVQADTQRAEFAEWVRHQEPFDLVFIDGLHTAEGCRRDFETARQSARLIAVHDVVSTLVPDVGRVWADVKEAYADEFEFVEFVEQFPEVVAATGGTHMGVGLAIRRAPG
jgi:hypothetical protein